MLETEVLEWIRQASYLQTNDLLVALAARYKKLYPDFDVYLFTLPESDGQEREQQLEQIVDMIRRHA